MKNTVESGFPYAVADAPRKDEPAPPAHRRRRRPGVGLAYRTLAHPQLRPLFAGARPGAAAALFVHHDHGGWTSDALALALRAAAAERGIGPWARVHHPYGLLKSLLEAIGADAGAYFTDHTLTPPPPAPEPCGREDCDGHGWLWVLVDDVEHAVPCPTCPPAIRAGG